MNHPDPYTRCIKLDGTVDLERLKRLSRELQEDYERLHFSKSIFESALYDVRDEVFRRNIATGKVRDADWAVDRAAKAIEEADKYETTAFEEEVASQSNKEQK